MGAHDHAHALPPGTGGGRLGLAAAVNVGFAVVQVVVGLAIGSVAVLADALHQVVDAVGLVTALVASRLARRPADARATYGLGRADALGGLLSGALLLASVAWIAIEAVERLSSPIDVSGTGVIVVGVVALVVNGGSLLLVGDDEHQLSLRAARLHLLTDLGGSAVVVVTGVVLVNTDAAWVDPAASLLLVVAVLWSTVQLTRRAVSELLDRAPRDVRVDDVATVLLELPDVVAVHHVHARSLGVGRASVTAHLVVAHNLDVHAAQLLVADCSERLRARLGVDHTTLQVECHECADADHAVAGPGLRSDVHTEDVAG